MTAKDAREKTLVGRERDYGRVQNAITGATGRGKRHLIACTVPETVGKLKADGFTVLRLFGPTLVRW